MNLPSLRWPVASLRTYLVVAILLATVPLAGVLVPWQIQRNLEAQQERQRGHLLQRASDVAAAVDREIAAIAGALRIVGELGDQGELEPTQALVDRLRRSGGWASRWGAPFVAGRNGRPLGGPLGADPVLPGMATLAGDPVVSGPVPFADGRPRTAVAVPIRPADGEPFYLGLWIETPFWRTLLEQGAGREGLQIRLLSPQGQVIAASTAGAGVVGTSLPALADKQALTPLQLAAIDGTSAAHRMVDAAGWSVVVERRDPAPIPGRWLAIAGPLAGALGSLLLGVLLALYVARRVTVPLRQLAIDGRTAPSADIAVREIALLRDALQSARAQDEDARGLLQAKAAEFQTLFESSPIGLAFAQDPQCRSVLHNAAMNSSFAAEAAADVQVFHAGVALEPGQQPLQRAARRGETTVSLELELAVDGMPRRHVLASAVPLRDLTGKPRGAIGAVVDITDRKIAEARLLSIDRRLRESQRLVDLAQEAGHVGFFYYRFEQDVLGWTPGQAKLFGIEVTDEAEASIEVWAQRIDSATRAGIGAALERMVSDRSTEETLDFEIRLPDGSTRWLSNRLTLSYGTAGEPVQLVGISLDVTDQKRAERERDQLIEREQNARREAESANRAKDEFLGMLGHELRNPLSAISSAVEVLERVAPGSDVGQNARTIIARQTRHLARLLDDLLDVGRVISGKIALSKQVLDLSALVQRLITTLQLTGSVSHVIEVDVQPGWISGDAMRLEQIVSNLLANAVKYTPPGGRIAVALRRQDEQVQLEVRDSGIGIPEALLPRIFDLFVQGERSLDRRSGGLGIGLTLVQRLVQLHGGQVSAESSSAGSVFRVQLPAVEAPPLRDERTVRTTARKRRVLVVEDNTDARLALQSILELMGHSVEAASDGPSGLQGLVDLRPDAAVVDIGLPGLSGLEVARESRRSGYAGRLIAVSGYGQAADVRQAMLAGFDAYLVKPVNPDELERRMEDDD